MEILFIGTSVPVPWDWDPSRQEKESTLLCPPSAAIVKSECQVLVIINHWFIYHAVQTFQTWMHPHVLKSPVLEGSWSSLCLYASPHTSTMLISFPDHPCLPTYMSSLLPTQEEPPLKHLLFFTFFSLLLLKFEYFQRQASHLSLCSMYPIARVQQHLWTLCLS